MGKFARLTSHSNHTEVCTEIFEGRPFLKFVVSTAQVVKLGGQGGFL